MLEKPDTKITRGTKHLIKEAISAIETEQDKNNRYKICEQMCLIAEERYQGNNLAYQLNRMDIPTTGKVLEKIDAYFYIHNRMF